MAKYLPKYRMNKGIQFYTIIDQNIPTKLMQRIVHFCKSYNLSFTQYLTFENVYIYLKGVSFFCFSFLHFNLWLLLLITKDLKTD